MNENKIPYQKYLRREGNDWIYQELTEEDIEKTIAIADELLSQL